MTEMYAVVKSGARQYKVSSNDIIKVERLPGEIGEVITLEEVLMTGDAGGEPVFGVPLIEGASVSAEIIDQIRAKKILVFKKRRRQNYRRRKGHRQYQTVLRIGDILTGGAKPKAAAGKVTGNGPDPDTESSGDQAAGQLAPDQQAAAGKAPIAEHAPMTYETAPDQRDDLKVISGVGPKLEEKLNELGIYTYAQIAAWTPENVAFIDERLSFKGRIERDDWIAKAAELAATREGDKKES